MKLIGIFVAALCSIYGEACAMNIAKEVAKQAAWEAGVDAVKYVYDHRDDIADAVDHARTAQEKEDRETSARIKESVDRGDYFDAAMDYEGSGRDPGDGCVIM